MIDFNCQDNHEGKLIMTLNNILNEVGIEFGDGKVLAVGQKLRQRTTVDKTGAKDSLEQKVVDINTLSNSNTTKSVVNNAINYLKQKGLFEKVATKSNLKTTDMVNRADGSAVINFDDGGSIVIPANILSGQSKELVNQKQTFLSRIKKGFTASVEDEEIEESYFGY